MFLLLILQMTPIGLGSDCILFPTCRRHVAYCTHLGISVCAYESDTPNAGSWRSLVAAYPAGAGDSGREGQCCWQRIAGGSVFVVSASLRVSRYCAVSRAASGWAVPQSQSAQRASQCLGPFKLGWPPGRPGPDGPGSDDPGLRDAPISRLQRPVSGPGPLSHSCRSGH